MKRYTLLISDTAPLYPPLWGGPKRIWNLFAGLAGQDFEVVYSGLDTSLKNGRAYDYARLADHIEEFTFALPAHYRPWYEIEKIIFGISSLNLFLYLAASSVRQFRHMLNSVEANLVVCSHPWAS